MKNSSSEEGKDGLSANMHLLYATELIHDPEFEQLVVNVCRAPGMFVGSASYGAVCAFLDGFNKARGGGPLIGIHQWLVLRTGSGNNRIWSALARDEISREISLRDEERVIEALGRLLAEFFEYRRTNGLTKIFHDYAKWLLRKSWYHGPLRQRKPE
jgi:hypothetical protein